MESHRNTVIDLRAGVRLRLTGPDASRYLNGQVTNDIRKWTPGTAMPACIANHKGKLEAFVTICRDADGAWCVAGDADVRDSLPGRLEKYLIADDAQVEDVTESTALVHVCGPAAGLDAIAPAPGEIRAAWPRLGIAGCDVWTTPEAAAEILTKFPALSADEATALRIRHRIPAWSAELGPDVFPQEVRLDESAVDFFKGCYIGQEVISRLRSVGRVNRLLEAFRQTGGDPLVAGWGIYGRRDDGGLAECGRLTSVARSGDGSIALGFLRRGTTGPLVAGPSADEATTTIELTMPLDE